MKILVSKISVLNFSVILSLMTIFFTATNSFKLFAQCETPGGITSSSTSSECATSGTITVSSVDGGSGVSLQYALYNSDNTIEIKDWQEENVFDNLAAGTYTIRVRYECTTGYSGEYTSSQMVSGSYATPIITSITVNRRSECNNGRITVTGSGGKTPYTYAIVPLLSTPEPMGMEEYIREPQSSRIFDSLAPGTYNVRLYDACGSYTTNFVTVNAFTSVNPFPNAGFGIQYKPCDSLSGTVTTNSYSDYVPGTVDTIQKLWMVYPNGTTDTFKRNFSSGLRNSFPLTMSHFGEIINDERFPENIGGTWPKTFQAGYMNACGEIHVRNYIVNKPNYKVEWVRDISSSGCDSAAYRFRITDSANSFTLSGIPEVVMNSDMAFSIDEGDTWTEVISSGEYTQEIKIPVSEDFNACLAWCMDTVCLTGTIAAPATLNAGVAEDPIKACEGNTGFKFYCFSGSAPITVEMVDGPDGQEFPTSTIGVIASGVTAQELSQGINMLPGTYTFKFTDACGNEQLETVTTVFTAPTFDLSYTFPCGSSEMKILIEDYVYQRKSRTSGGSVSTSGYFVPTNSIIRAKIYKADSTVAHISTFSNVGNFINIPGTTISALPEGDYFIRVWRRDAPDSLCAFVDLPWTKNPTLISLTNSVSINTCPGETTTGSIIGVANGGSGVYSYSLYLGSVSTENLVAGPQPDNIFNNLNADETYVLTVSDDCGRGTQITISFGDVGLPVYNNAGGFMPCPGEELILSAENMPGVTYQWYKDDVVLDGETSHTLTILPIEEEDAGVYKVEFTAGSCAIYLASFELDPSECGAPLPIELLHFDAVKNGASAHISWSTASELNNKNFEVQKSVDAKNWTTIGSVTSKADQGMSNQVLKYEYIDNKPFNGINYYRLMQIDLDGQYKYSYTRRLDWSADNNSLQVSPNPFDNILTIDGLIGNYTVELFDNLGKSVLNTELQLNGKASINIGNIASGNYILKLTDKKTNKIYTKKLVKQ